ncbi:hypothetical protein E2C01_074051 [Portunus trituberculatus]|uniref:Uncharacterized protein n=1 Tax=Portunus trituberculatus TaxID=210409 RepID=A0A5B7I709_PORTR|nr:hypothetical protein [Portunus trituberculatus]
MGGGGATSSQSTFTARLYPPHPIVRYHRLRRTLKVMGHQSKMKTNQKERMKKLNESRREEEEG